MPNAMIPQSTENPLALSAALAVGFLGADAVARRLPPTVLAQLGWGSIATFGTFLIAREVTPSLARALTIGVAGAYLHAYGHGQPYRSRE